MASLSPDPLVTILGAGLAGCEAAYQCSKRGVAVELWEQRPGAMTKAHRTGDLAELVCSNSLKSLEPTNAHGLLKAELDRLDSLLLRIAHRTQIPGGKALVVDRAVFAREVTEAISGMPGVTLRREQARTLPETGIVIVATGPLTSAPLAGELSALLGSDNLAFYDAISPIVDAESIDRERCFAANRYIAGDDYLNCPLSVAEYVAFYQALVSAEVHQPHGFDTPADSSQSATQCFEGCMPIEDIARRGRQVLLFGPMKPVGLVDPVTGRQPFAVVQLRRENQEATMYNLVGFQTRMTQGEQRRVLRMIPALANAEFLRHGSVHRNTYLNAPVSLKPTLQTLVRDTLFVAGQLTGVEGYVESIAAGFWAGVGAARLSRGQELLACPESTMLGGLLKYITTPNKRFQPMNANFGLLPVPNVRRAERRQAHFDSSKRDVAGLVSRLAE